MSLRKVHLIDAVQEGRCRELSVYPQRPYRAAELA